MAINSKTATLADAANALYKAEQAYQRKKREFEEKLAVLREARDKIEAAMLEDMLTMKQEAISTKLATIAVRRTTFAELYDDKAFFDYVGKHKAWELVRKQPVVSACKERWENAELIPGVRPGTKTELSITARRKS